MILFMDTIDEIIWDLLDNNLSKVKRIEIENLIKNNYQVRERYEAIRKFDRMLSDEIGINHVNISDNFDEKLINEIHKLVHNQIDRNTEIRALILIFITPFVFFAIGSFVVVNTLSQFNPSSYFNDKYLLIIAATILIASLVLFISKFVLFKVSSNSLSTN